MVIGVVSWLLEYALSFTDPEGPVTLGRAAARWVYAGLWWLASLLGIWLADTFTVRSWRQYPRMAFHAVAGAAISVAWAVVAYYINLAIIPGWRPEGVQKMINTTSMMMWFIYTGLVILAHTLIYAREYRIREVRALRAAQLATEAELQALKMQLQPHFLFNALNSISTLMHRDVRAANEMLALVAEMLERGLHRVRTQEVTLAEEVKTAELFLQIEQVRFQDRLSVVWSVDLDVEEALVPHMLLQPIIDNSLRHGIQAKSGRGRIEISARRRGDQLNIQVMDDGRGLSGPGGEAGFGIGLSVTRERLSKLYGRNHSFLLENAPGGGAVVRITIPYTYGEDTTTQEATHAQADSRPDR
jgi:two-component system LytT family sensor kinase